MHYSNVYGIPPAENNSINTIPGNRQAINYRICEEVTFTRRTAVHHPY